MGSTYYHGLFIILCSFLCVSHVKQKWPEEGWKPASSMGNVAKQEERAKAQPKRRKEEAQRAAEQAGRRADRVAAEVLSESAIRDHGRSPDPRGRRDGRRGYLASWPGKRSRRLGRSCHVFLSFYHLAGTDGSGGIGIEGARKLSMGKARS